MRGWAKQVSTRKESESPMESLTLKLMLEENGDDH